MKNNLLFILSLLFFTGTSVTAQTCGFGCLGFSGFYGGYTVQQYDMGGINSFIEENPQFGGAFDESVKFEMGTGPLIGIYLVKAKFDDVFFSIKGFYQFMDEKHEVAGNTPYGNARVSYSLKYNYFGAMVDIGLPVSDYFDLKLLEGGVTFHDVEFKRSTVLDNLNSVDLKWETDDPEIGYIVGSGIVIHLLRDYISFEGSLYYNFVDLNSMDEKGGIIPLANSLEEQQVEQGGLAASIQLNLGFPL